MFSIVVHLKLGNVYQKYIRSSSNKHYSYWFSIILKATALQNSYENKQKKWLRNLHKTEGFIFWDKQFDFLANSLF